MADERLQRGASGHLLKTATGHLANTCEDAGLQCDDCDGYGPITCTITTSGSCDEVAAGCDYDCAGDVFNLVHQGAQTWFGGSSIPGPSTGWTCEVKCVDPGTWTITVEGGCGDDNFINVSKWTNIAFVPTGCVTSFAVGYPTHAGVNLGNPTTNGDCWVSCVPTVALS